jgi:hypothetical protein
MQVQQPKIGGRAGRQHPFTGNISNLRADELDVFDGRLAARSHTCTQRRQVEALCAEWRVLA